MLANIKYQYIPHFLNRIDSDFFFERFQLDISWEQPNYAFSGRNVPMPRMIKWFGDNGIQYSYSGINRTTTLWSHELMTLKVKVENTINKHFNSCLASLYRDGKDNVSWHSDNAPELGSNPFIANISLGEERQFQWMNKETKEVFSQMLGHGSLFLMFGDFQDRYVHRLPQMSKSSKPRINLTFRNIEGNTLEMGLLSPIIVC